MTKPYTSAPHKYQWRVVDIVVASVLGVASGVIFWAWDQLWNVASIPLAILPGAVGILSGGWLFAAILGGLVIRKPGAALYTELVAGTVELILGSQFGWTGLASALLQGLGAEIVFAIFLYRTWTWWVAVLAGVGAAIALALRDILTSYVATDALFKTIYSSSALISGAIFAGLLGWLAVRGLAKTGALSRFAAGREVTQRV
jgi:energy-coupling factor transport system permease protein